MYDKKLAQYILEQILEAIHKIEKRFNSISGVEDFTNTPEGKLKFE